MFSILPRKQIQLLQPVGNKNLLTFITCNVSISHSMFTVIINSITLIN